MILTENYYKHLKRGQVSIEFIVMVSFVMFIFIGLLIVFNNRMIDATAENDRLQVENIKDQLYAQLYNAASASGDYTNDVNMAAHIGGESFDMIIEDRVTLLITYKQKNYIFPLPEKVSGQLIKESIDGGWVYQLNIRKNLLTGEILVTTTCGNILDPGEACDDGNRNDFDACLSDCTLSSCGDGHLYLTDEACDDDNNLNGDGCDINCQIELGWVCVGNHPSVCELS